MRHLFRVLYALLLLAPGRSAVGQFALEGRIVDQEAVLPLAAVNVHIVGTTRGTVTNSDGRFRLWIPTDSAVVEFRHVAYEPKRLLLQGRPGADLVVRLEPAVYRLSLFEVSAEDPAIGIMREVIRRKQEWMAGLVSWRADAYTRLVVRNDTGIVALTESASRAFWRRGEGLREIVLGNRTSENLDLAGYMPAAALVQDFYQDEIELAGHRFPGVTHPDALTYYDFSLTGYQEGSERRLLRIAVRPRSTMTPLFQGSILVVDSLYALEAVELEPNQAFRFPIPIRSYRSTYAQQFRSQSEGVWLPVDFRSRGEVSIAIPGLRFPVVRFEQLSRISDYELNGDTPDSLFERRRPVVATPAPASQSDLAALVEIVPLTEEELRAYSRIDSTLRPADAFKPRGALARYFRTTSSAGRAEAGLSAGLSLRGVSVIPRFWYNRVESLHLGAAVGAVAGRWRVSTETGWSTGLRRPEWAGRVSLSGSRPRWSLDMSHVRGSQTRLQSAFYGRPWASAAMLLGEDDYFDYYWRASSVIGIHYGSESPLPLDFEAGFRIDRDETLVGHRSYDFVGRDKPQRQNPGIRDGVFRRVTIRTGAGRKPGMLIGARRASLETEAGWGEAGYIRYVLAVDWRLRTFHQRRPLSNTLDVRCQFGASHGDLPPQRFLLVEGGVLGLHPFGSLRTLRGRPFEGEMVFAGFWEHDFRTTLFERTGLSWFADRGMGLMVHGAHAYAFVRGSTKGDLDFPVRVTGGMHHEIGLSLTNLFGAPIRLDVTERLSRQRALFVGIGVSRQL